MDLGTATTEELKEELKKRGYSTDSLWQNEDVTNKLAGLNQRRAEDGLSQIELSEEDKKGIMTDVLGNEYVMQTINETIEYYLREHVTENGLED